MHAKLKPEFLFLILTRAPTVTKYVSPVFSPTIRRIRGAIVVTPALPLVKVLVQASIYPYNLHTPRPMIFKLVIDIHHSKLVMPREFGVNRSKLKFTVTCYIETVHG